jgi:hypothetical protein
MMIFAQRWQARWTGRISDYHKIVIAKRNIFALPELRFAV